MRSRACAYVLLTLLVAVTFGPSLRDDFGSDDFSLVDSARSATIGELAAAFLPSHAGDLFADLLPGVRILFALEYRLFGDRPYCYRMVSILLHLVTCLLVFELGRRILRRAPVAFVAASLFAVHPAHGQAVLWNAAASHVLAAAATLAALLLFLDALESAGTARPAYAASIAMVFVAMFTKDSAATLPVTLLLAELLLGPIRPFRGAMLAKYVPVALVTMLFVANRLAAASHSYLTQQAHYVLGTNMLRRFADYVAYLAFPLSASSFRALLGMWSHQLAVVAPAATVSVLAALAGLVAWRFRTFPGARPTLFLVSWLVLAPVPFLGFTWEPHSRYLYLAAIPFCLLTSVAVANVWDVLEGVALRRVLAGALAAAIAVGTALTLLVHERSAYMTGALSRSLLVELRSITLELPPGTRIRLIDSPLSRESALPVVQFAYPRSYTNLASLEVTPSANAGDVPANPLRIELRYDPKSGGSWWESFTSPSGRFHR